ncbi:E3 ubiquitin-protein ligase XIAP isoform X2 [Octopus bimaculoides]|uniref:E3 ubiquitin-protein ligase XIAP isoform X2 n=1 Tax=Octopus bimaculoides TaxID=37653 RepID=UPI00071E4289|nr:E3 ubiquitin-protein ligase XIAP isoform X2 [Octopus bimaculoides]|eukprot:XP_014770937.1 PREDICTED: E3 ubiquitin-protein ligase XIAP-like isoform X2 [Octopus bimaculoides]
MKSVSRLNTMLNVSDTTRDHQTCLKTFQTAHFPKSHIISPIELAKNGFEYTGIGDRVRCVYCQGMLDDWQLGDSVEKEHRRHFPYCPFVQERDMNDRIYNSTHIFPSFLPDSFERFHTAATQPDYVPYAALRTRFGQNSTAQTQLSSLHSAAQNGWTSDVRDSLTSRLPSSVPTPVRIPFSIQTALPSQYPYSQNLSLTALPTSTAPVYPGEHTAQHSAPGMPRYASLHERIRTFQSWPHKKPSREWVAEAGFYQLGIDDTVCCYMCNGHLREWDESDNPWIEHAKFFPNCLYLRNMKGDAFVAEICRNLEHLPKDNRNRVITQRSFTTADHMSFAGQPGQAGFSNSLPEVFSSSGQSTFSSSHHPSGFSNPNNLTGLTNSSQRAFLNTGQVEFSNSGERPIFRLPYHSNITSCMDPILDELRLLPDVKGPVNRTAAASSHLSTTEHRQLQQPQAQHHQVPVPPVQPSWSSQETNPRLFGSIHTSSLDCGHAGAPP